MQEKLFLWAHRVGFLANICFAICWWMQWKGDFVQQPDVSSVIIILGWLVAPIWNGLLQVWALWRLIHRTQMNQDRWLLLTNLAFFIFQVSYLFVFTQ